MVWLAPFSLGVAYGVFGIAMSDKQALISANVWMAVAYMVARK
jgi:hypothetical protein